MRSPTVPCAVAEPLQDGVHLRMQALQLASTQFVDLVGRQRRGGRRLKRPPVVLVAARPRPHSGVVRRHGSLCLQLGNCRSSAGATSCAAIVRARSAQSPGMFLVRRSIDSTSVPPSRAFLPRASFAPSPYRSGTPGARGPLPARPGSGQARHRVASHSDCSRARYASASAAFSIRWSLSRNRGISRYAPTF